MHLASVLRVTLRAALLSIIWQNHEAASRGWRVVVKIQHLGVDGPCTWDQKFNGCHGSAQLIAMADVAIAVHISNY